MFRIIDNKKIWLTDAEWTLYNDICKSYDEGTKQRGKDLFVDLFEVNEDGIIVALIPPTRQTSFEIIFFLVFVFQHQHMRLMHKQIDDVCKKIDNKLAELEKAAVQNK